MSSPLPWGQWAAQHYDWVERMGWHNKTVLEAQALIASEIGEAAGECLGPVPTAEFGEELADIVLRTVDLAHWQGVRLNDAVPEAATVFVADRPLAQLAEVMVTFGHWVNTARSTPLHPDFGRRLGEVLRAVQDIAHQQGIDLEAHILRKMAINELRGTRGRRI